MDTTAALARLPGLQGELQVVADRLKRITVQVRTRSGGEGSGIIWSQQGWIVTNAHVAQSRWPVVELSDGRIFDAELHWRDPRRDLALLTIPASELPVASLADIAGLRAGELVLAVGHPFGLCNAVSLGVLHQVDQAGGGHHWLRADIRLAPGNSGGPLADATGNVIGLNTLVMGELALAIPVTAVAAFLSEIDSEAA